MKGFIIQLLGLFQSSSIAAIKRDLDEIKRMLMATEKQVAEALNQITAQLGKANAEIQSKISDLETAIQNQTEASPELIAALEALKPAAQALDDIVPDAPADGSNPTPPATT